MKKKKTNLVNFTLFPIICTAVFHYYSDYIKKEDNKSNEQFLIESPELKYELMMKYFSEKDILYMKKHKLIQNDKYWESFLNYCSNSSDMFNEG